MGETAGMLSDAESDAIRRAAGDVTYRWDLRTDRLQWNGAILPAGITLDCVPTGEAYARFLHPQGGAGRAAALAADQREDEGDGVPYTCEYALRGPTDEWCWVADRGRWHAGADGRPARAEGVVRMVNMQHAEKEHLRHLAETNVLTGTLNRSALTARIEDALEEAQQLRKSFGFILLTIDHLDRLNETLGITVGDEVICAVAQAISQKLRGGDCFGHFSGNKFGILLRDCTQDDLAIAGERFLSCVRDGIVETSAGPAAVTVTLGGVVAPRHAATVDDILAHAHSALTDAKRRRRGSFEMYRPSPERDAARRVAVRCSDEVVSALNDRRIALAFEPVVETLSRRPAFYECGIRIRRPDGSLMMPAEFVPVAEHLGLIRLVDYRVAELVVAELGAAPSLQASLNVSAESTSDPDWWSGLAAVLRNEPTIAQRLIVEITESAAVESIADARGFVRRVKDLGCRIAVDDFGAGHTSFRILREIGADIVKIDGSFVERLARSPDDRIFVQTLIDLANRLGLETVAEWVQTRPRPRCSPLTAANICKAR